VLLPDLLHQRTQRNLTDASKKKAATKELDKSKAAMKKGDMKGCVSHME
jgi:hypothetical protein